MSTVLGIAGGLVGLALVGYVVIGLALDHEGRRLVNRCVRAPRAGANGDEKRIYVRRSLRRRMRAPDYEIPTEVDLEAAVGGGELAPPPAAWDGSNPDA